ncbi:MAG: amino acid permease, partial [Terriglobia bacterium]
NFFAVFARLHPTKGFPHVSLLLIGRLSAVASLGSLTNVIAALMTARIVIQFLGQIIALHWLRAHRPELARPFRMVCYPLPSLLAFTGWTYVFAGAGGKHIAFGLLTILCGCAIYFLKAKVMRMLPAA